MAGANVDIGTGTTITFADSAFSAELLSVNGSGLARASVDTTHLGTVGGMTFIPTDLVDSGEFEIEIHFNPDNFPPIDAPVEVITITFPLVAGDSTPAKWVCEGFMTNFDWGVQLEDKMTASATIKLSGLYAPTDAT